MATLPCLSVAKSESTIGALGEAGLLSKVFARLEEGRPQPPSLLVGPGDDTAYLAVPGPAVLATTDTMVRGRDWLDEWSSAADVGSKVVTQNLADLSAMGGIGTALLVTLVAPGSTPTRWVLECVGALADSAYACGVSVAGGDLSSSVTEVSISVTALGVLGSGVQHPVLRSGARSGQVLAVSGELGRSAAGLELLRRADTGWFPHEAHADVCASWVGYHCRPHPDLEQGTIAALAGATSMIDVSDGLIRDAGRIAAASSVRIDVRTSALKAFTNPIERALGAIAAQACVLEGGEEHVLLGTFDESATPPGWTVVGEIADALDQEAGVWLEGEQCRAGGWDHFGG